MPSRPSRCAESSASRCGRSWFEHYPTVLTAAGRHARIVHQHKDFTTFAMRDARRILHCWWCEGRDVTAVLRLREITVDEYSPIAAVALVPSNNGFTTSAWRCADRPGRSPGCSTPLGDRLGPSRRQRQDCSDGRCGGLDEVTALDSFEFDVSRNVLTVRGRPARRWTRTGRW